jgi:GTP-binding protein EngB required for normal cell division
MFSRVIPSNWTSPDQLLDQIMSTDAHVDPAATKSTPQKTPLSGRGGVAQLTSYEQRDLLDAVDKLRRAEIPGRDFSIPQVIVCGDQSTGKSSVLEAISQLRFPVGAQFTTKLPTEVVLRNNSSPSIAPVTLTIIADKSRTPEQKAHLDNFAFQVDVDDPNAFTSAVNAAFQYLTLYEPHVRLWYDRLHVEISGPTQPNLTLVDLPGLIQNEAQVNPGDKKRIRNLVKRYIAEPKAIILAVVRADNDLANQGITQLVKDHRAANRTMGILTRVDRLITASEDEKAATDLVRDQDPSLSLGLGWHALAKMSDETPPPVTFEDRDEAERRFFTRLPWSGLDRGNLGIATLREKLSLRLFSLITHDLAGFVGQLEDKFEECRLRYDTLGEARISPGSQSYHLQRIQRDFQSLVRDALDGRYDRSDFASFFDGSSHRDLRATINQYSGEFAAKIREQGKQYHVFGTPEQRGR